MIDVDSSRASNQVLHDLLKSVLHVLGETLGSLVAQKVQLKPLAVVVEEPAALARTLEGQSAIVRGAFDKDYAGKTVRVVLDARDATSLACHLMLTADEVIRERRARGTLEGEDLESFGEVANVLCSGIDQALRTSVKGTIGVRLQDHGVLTGPTDPKGMLGDQALVGIRFKLKLATYPESQGLLLLDQATAEAWNGGPLTASAKPLKEEGSVGPAPEAPIRARLAAFMVDHDAVSIVRCSCRRVGLELDRRTRTEIPNPAAHKDQLLLIEMAPGEDRRFEWCRRIKQYDPGIKVILLLHFPSRARVLQGIMVRADAILGWPATEAQLSQKLLPLLPQPEM